MSAIAWREQFLSSSAQSCHPFIPSTQNATIHRICPFQALLHHKTPPPSPSSPFIVFGVDNQTKGHDPLIFATHLTFYLSIAIVFSTVSVYHFSSLAESDTR